MWFRTEDLGDPGEAYLESVGRASLVAQLFEDMVKRTLYWYDVSREAPHIETSELRAFLEVKVVNPEESFERKLARAIDRLKAHYALRDEGEDLLIDAKDARNYLAHQAAIRGFDLVHSPIAPADVLAAYRDHVEALVRGYNLLSVWAYEAEEREPAPHRYSRWYPQHLEGWVLAPIAGLIDHVVG